MLLMQDTALALPSEAAMRAKDKYTTYSPHDPNFRKSLHRASLCISR